MFDRDQAIASLLQALWALGYVLPTMSDAIEQAHRGAALDSDDAAFVAGRRASTVARWAQAAEDEGASIAVKCGSSWLFVTTRLLDYIERKFGLHTRREAETRHRKLIEMRARAQTSTSNASRHAAAAAEACHNGGSETEADPDQPETRAVDMG
ncbi:MAG TPA: hypothetical protein VE999_12295 [Gemmataceae bacterium]|jgi:hypothetical protein|nr:hypothetical protein [Gemmataceae bacterium]